jgi:hypothetical protein
MSATRIARRRRRPTSGRGQLPPPIGAADLRAHAEAVAGTTGLTISHCGQDHVFVSYGRSVLSFQCAVCKEQLPARLRVAEFLPPHHGLSEGLSHPLVRPELDVLVCRRPGCDHRGHDGLVLHSACHHGQPTTAHYHDGHLAAACSVCKRFVTAIQVGE